jgi:putative DNA primase/helicase
MPLANQNIGEQSMDEGQHKPDVDNVVNIEDVRAKRAENQAEAELPPEYSEGALSERFTERYASILRYVEQWNSWMYWNGQKWIREKSHAFHFARLIAREASVELRQMGNSKAATIVYSNRVVAAIESLARKNTAHLTPWDAFDADDWLFNTPGGIVDLRTGKVLPNDPKHMLTKMTAVAPDFTIETPRWNEFLKDATANDPVLGDFLRRLSGYALTGSTKEEIICFIYGPEGTGKTTFMETVAKAMGDYATVAVIESLTVRKNTMSDRHTTDVAKLQGARLARAAETEEGRYWAAAKIKELTGGDTATARFMRQDNVDFVPKCKIIIHGNHKPKIRNPEGIRRRLILIDFPHQIPEAKKNINLKEELKAEAPGILAWCIRGCLEWQKDGLNPPEKVQASTKAYFQEQEVVGNWLDECLELTGNPNDKVKSTVLYQHYKKWCQDNGEEWLSQKLFSPKLEELGVVKAGKSRNAMFKGIRLPDDIRCPDDLVATAVPPRQPVSCVNNTNGRNPPVDSPPITPDNNSLADLDMDAEREWFGRLARGEK